jgi:Cys-rich repeat protein
MRTVLGLVLAFAIGACSTYREDLNRGQRLYEENEYEHALAIWRVLESDMDSLDLTDQSRYAYLRGMTDYRLGFRPDARHWLAIARAIEQEHPGGLSPQWKQRLDEALADLNRDVYGGAETVATGAPPPGAPPAPGAPAAAPPPGEGAKTGACAADSDCPSGNRCQAGACVPL